METVGIKTLKNKLSEYVRRAASGETVLVTDRGTVVAELNPPHARQPLSREEFTAKGIREGWLRPALHRTGKPPPRIAAVPFDELMREIEQDREDR
jgi:antitoxin (DNA-binding transcriptional repressor) of toxin-antitoxin stability system